MKIDFEHWQGSLIGQEIITQLDLDRELSIFKALNPKFSKDGNQFCFLYGELPNDCIIGFGDTANQAMKNFILSFYNSKAININKKNKL